MEVFALSRDAINTNIINTNIKYRLEFSKTDKMIYIGHLDLLTFFQRVFKRSKLPIGYSWGFNPHQLVTFAIPLALGTSSVGEVVDIQLKERVDTQEIKDRVNKILPQGISIMQVNELEFASDSCAAAVKYADYSITLDKKIKKIDEVINEIINSTEINIERTVKKKTKIVDIRKYINWISADNSYNTTEINCNIATGSQGNLKVDVMLEYIYTKLGEEFSPMKIDILRTSLYTSEEGVLVPLCPGKFM